MFKKNNSMENPGYYDMSSIQRISYQLEENNRKLRNLNNRLRRIENYLGLRNDDKYDEDIFSVDQY